MRLPPLMQMRSAIAVNRRLSGTFMQSASTRSCAPRIARERQFPPLARRRVGAGTGVQDERDQLVYPIWFGLPPRHHHRLYRSCARRRADRVGHPPQRAARGARDKICVLITTSGSTLPWFGERGQWEGMHEAFNGYLEKIFSFAGVEHEDLARPSAGCP